MLDAEDIVIYLAGSIAHRPAANVVSDRESVKKALDACGMKYIDPFEWEQKGYSEWKYANVDLNNSKLTNVEIVDKNIRDMMLCNVFLVIDGHIPSWGKAMELMYAKMTMKGAPRIIIDKRGNGKLIGWPAWGATKIVADIEEAIDWLLDFWAA